MKSERIKRKVTLLKVSKSWRQHAANRSKDMHILAFNNPQSITGGKFEVSDVAGSVKKGQ